MLKIIEELFAEPPHAPPPTGEDIWQGEENMRAWLLSAFDAILSAPAPAKEGVIINVPPYKIRYSARGLYSLGLLSLFIINPEDSSITKQDFDYLFCDTALKYFSLSKRGARKEKSALFVAWIARSLYMIASENDNEFLECMQPGAICSDLLRQASSDPLFARLDLTEWAQFIPLLVSILFTIHIQGLWTCLYDRLHERDKPQFKLLELFLNVMAEEDLRFRTVKRELVTEVLQEMKKHDAAHPDLRLDDTMVYYVLLKRRAAEEPPTKKADDRSSYRRPSATAGRQRRRAKKAVKDEEINRYSREMRQIA